MTIQRNLKYFAQSQPQKICLTYKTNSLTYGELAAITQEMALGLASQFPKGTKVVIKQADPIKTLCYLFATAQAGLIAIVIDSKLTADFYQRLLLETGASVIIDEYYILPREKNNSLPLVHEEDVFLGALSSGSTGHPKVIWRDHKSWTKAFPFQSSIFNLDGSDKLFLMNSLAYTANLNSCLHLLDQGGSVFFASRNWPRSWVKEIREQGITAIFMVPANYRMLLKVLDQPLTKVTSLVSAGAKIDLETVSNILHKCPGAKFYEYYGASELGHVTYNTYEDLLKFPHSVGRAFPGVEFWVEQGRIIVASPYLAPAYRPQATIGDLGEVNSQGYLFLLGRENGLINKGGVKIIPEQLENILRKCPGVLDVLVKGEIDAFKGQKVVAWIVAHEQNKPLIQQLRQFCMERLPKHQRPDLFYFTGKIPRNANGKVIRKD